MNKKLDENIVKTDFNRKLPVHNYGITTHTAVYNTVVIDNY